MDNTVPERPAGGARPEGRREELRTERGARANASAGQLTLLETKLHMPAPRRGTVLRRRLIERLECGMASAVTLVSAPAGFGKTTVMASWLTSAEGAARAQRSVAWLSLDRADNEPGRFWAYVLAALATATPALSGNQSAPYEGSASASSEQFLIALLNKLVALDNDVVLVLDDYQVIESRDIHEGMAFLLDRMPDRLHVVIGCRADPPLPLARLRAGGQLVELRAADLRFTADEVAAYLTDIMELPLSAQDVATLGDRTEGWIAALQLAAISLRGRDDVAGFVDEFAGDDRYIVDYLVQEVLQSQPESTRLFLLQTSILARMNGSLCDAVTGQRDSRATLEALERANLFLIPLDDRRRWYRYHHLFADVLRARLADQHPGTVAELHRRASAWHAEHGELDTAIGHALAAPEPPSAASLVERAIPALRQERREVALRGWLEALPVEIFRDRPVLSVAYAGALLSTGETEGVEARLRDAERWLGESGPAPRDGAVTEAVVVDELEYRRLPAMVAVYRAGLALTQGDAVTTADYARRALSLLEPDDHFRRGAASALLGLASWGSGDVETAYRAYADSSSSLLRAGYISDVLGCAVILGDLRIVQGRLTDASAIFDDVMQLARAQNRPDLRGTPDILVGVSAISRERGDLTAAAEHLRVGYDLGERARMPKFAYRWRVAMAELRQSQGDLDEAVSLLDEAESVYVADFAPPVRPVAASRARVWLAQGKVAEATAWARAQELSADDELTYVREFEHVTLARILLARHRQLRSDESLRDAVGLLGRILDAARSGGRNGTVIEVLLLQALAEQQSGDFARAVSTLEEALVLAEPEGYARVFVDEGARMTKLLEAASAHRTVSAYAARLVTMLGAYGPAAPSGMPGGIPHESLSDREREVLHLLGTDLTGPEIARQLVVSLNTVRTHTKNIYTKLGVSSRRAAVRRADELGISGSARRRPS